MENENIVSVILYDATRFTVGDKYRFCLVLLRKKNDQNDLVVGCSNITKLKQIENVLETDRTVDPIENPISVAKNQIEGETDQLSSNGESKEMISDISTFEKISDFTRNEQEPPTHEKSEDDSVSSLNIDPSQVDGSSVTSSTLKSVSVAQPMDEAYASLLMSHLNSSLLPSLSIAVLLTSMFAFIWAATKITHYRRSVPSTVCYAATSDQHSLDMENSSRYLKLQATTTL